MLANWLVRARYAALLILLVVGIFILAQVTVEFIIIGIVLVFPDVKMSISSAVGVTASTAITYLVAISGLIGFGTWKKTKPVTRKMLGLGGLISWSDLGIGLLAAVPYIILSGVLISVLSGLWTGIDPMQEQSIPFTNLSTRIELLAAFLALVVAAPIAEETLFRGYLLGKMKTVIRPWLSVILVALIFGALHLPGAVSEQGVTLQWAVAIDTFSLGAILGTLRIMTGSIWAGIVLHMLKNGVAFYFLFLSGSVPGTM